MPLPRGVRAAGLAIPVTAGGVLASLKPEMGRGTFSSGESVLRVAAVLAGWVLVSWLMRRVMSHALVRTVVAVSATGLLSRSTARCSSGSASAISAWCATSTASPPPGRSPTTTSSPGTRRPNSSTRCTANEARTPSTHPPPRPTPEPVLSHEPRIEQRAHDLKGAGLHPFPLPLGVLLDEAHPERSRCVRCATCDGFACLVNAKADAQVVCVEPALEHPNVSLLTGARVTRLVIGDRGRTVRSVVVDRDGRHEEYRADVVVVAAGAINSAALLFASADEYHPTRLGNSSGAVGRHEK
jgi:choline dehydrogenase-like flavoprotein